MSREVVRKNVKKMRENVGKKSFTFFWGRKKKKTLHLRAF